MASEGRRASQALTVEPLGIEAFEPFGHVIEPDAAREIRLINGGTTTRFHDLATVDVAAEGGRPLISIFRGKPFAMPVAIGMMERHPLGTQAFVPLHDGAYLVVVAPDEDGRPGPPRAFLGDRGRGVGYGRAVWHHPLLSLGAVSDFLVVDRGGPGANLEEADYAVDYVVGGSDERDASNGAGPERGGTKEQCSVRCALTDRGRGYSCRVAALMFARSRFLYV